MHACTYVVCHDAHVDVRRQDKSGELVLSFCHVIPGDSRTQVIRLGGNYLLSTVPSCQLQLLSSTRVCARMHTHIHTQRDLKNKNNQIFNSIPHFHLT